MQEEHQSPGARLATTKRSPLALTSSGSPAMRGRKKSMEGKLAVVAHTEGLSTPPNPFSEGDLSCFWVTPCDVPSGPMISPRSATWGCTVRPTFPITAVTGRACGAVTETWGVISHEVAREEPRGLHHLRVLVDLVRRELLACLHVTALVQHLHHQARSATRAGVAGRLGSTGEDEGPSAPRAATAAQQASRRGVPPDAARRVPRPAAVVTPQGHLPDLLRHAGCFVITPALE